MQLQALKFYLTSYKILMPKLLRAEVKMSKTYEIFEDLNPPERLLMGPGPVDVYPSVLRAIVVLC